MRKVKEIRRRLLGAAMALVMVLTMLPVTVQQAEAADIVGINDAQVFLKQQHSDTCTLVAVLMMFRRGALLNKNTNWSSFNEGNYYYNGGWWSSEYGLYFNLSGEGMYANHQTIITYDSAGNETTNYANKQMFINLLASHREGLAIHLAHSYGHRHAVILTDYDAATDTFYCADPSSAAASGRIRLADSSLASSKYAGMYTGKSVNTQEDILACIYAYWYISSGITYPPLNYLDQCTTLSSYCQIKTTQAANMNTLPRDYTKYDASENLAVIPSGTTLTATALVKNDVDNYWYKVAYDGKEGYVYAGNTQFQNMLTDDVKITGEVSPTYIQEGNSFNLYGTITVEKNEPLNFSGYIFRKGDVVSAGNSLMPYNGVGFNGSRSADIQYSAMDYTLKFGQLGVGEYRYYVELVTKAYYSDDGKNLQEEFAYIAPIDRLFTVGTSATPPTATVTYDANGGSGAPTSQTKTAGVDLTLSAARPNRSGYIFSGWATSANASTAQYQPGDSYTENGNATLYAVWETLGNWVAGHNAITANYGDSTYHYFSDKVTWYEANAISQYLGGHLATIADAAENSFVFAFDEKGQPWLGATDRENEGTWKWVTGEDFSYTNWNTGEPNNTTGNAEGSENYLHFSGVGDGTWNDVMGAEALPFVCEIANVTLTGITVATPPDFNVYKDGEKLDTTGLTLTATYSDGSTETITSGYTVSGFDSVTPGEKIVTVAYEGKTTTFTVTVTVLQEIVIEALPYKTEYELGEELDTEGLMLVAIYSDGGDIQGRMYIYGYTLSGFDSTTAGTKTVTATYDGKSVSFNVTVNAAPVVDPDAARIKAADVKGYIGREVKVTVSLQNNPGLTNLILFAGYDSSVLTLTKVEDGGILGKSVSTPNLNKNPYQLTWENDTAEANFTADGTLVTLTFTVAEDAPEGEYAVTLLCNAGDAYDFDLNDVAVATTDGKVTVKAVLLGDVDGNGTVNSKDRTIFSRYLAGWDGYAEQVILDACDVNGDGIVNGKDRTIFSRYLAGWDGYEEYFAG